MEYRPLQRQDLPGIVTLCKAEGWPSFVEAPDRAWRALTAPGVTTIVAVQGRRVVGFVQLQSDGEIQAHLSLTLVAADSRREGIATQLVEEAFRLSGAKRLDVVTDRSPAFYRSFAHKQWHGFRIYPQHHEGNGP
jgi:ribosomal protein S18 acetylase RimI-like enzyme